MMKSNNFSKELSYIKDERLRKSAEVLADNLPDYFYKVAASSTGKYHPSFSLGDGGLLRHTKVAVKIAKSLLDDPIFGDKYTSNQKDLMLIALMFHDGIKHGIPEDKYTKVDHPILASEFIKNNQSKTELDDEEVEFISECIKSHMGPWNTDYLTGEEILPKPHTKFQNFVHMCDYLASRKYLDVKFVNGEIEE